MKILIDARLYGLENAGLGRYLINLIGNLKADKNNQYILVLRDKYFNRLSLPTNFKKISLNVRHYGFKEQFSLPKIIKREKLDLVHYPHFNISLFSKAPFVVTIHDLLMHRQKGKEATTLPFYKYFAKRVFYKMIFRYAVKKSVGIMVPSCFVKEELIGSYGVDRAKIKVIYEGVEFAKSEKANGNILERLNIKKPYFLYVGSAYPHKNLKNAILAVKRLNERSPDRKVEFVIVSARNIFTKRLEKIVKNFDCESDVKIIGFVSDKQLSSLYNHSLAFIYPSLSEGFGLPGLEAMVHGTLCVCSDIAVFREIYGDNSIFFDPQEINSICAALEKVLEMDKKEREQFVRKSLEFAKKYSWAKMARKTIKVYEDSFSLRQNK